jgi:hypothetical protein
MADLQTCLKYVSTILKAEKVYAVPAKNFGYPIALELIYDGVRVLVMVDNDEDCPIPPR